MKFMLLLGACALIAFAVANLAVSALVALLWRRSSRYWSSRAGGWLLLLRVFPAAFSTTFVALAFVPSFLAHEPRQSPESVNWALGLGAGLGLALVVFSAGRVLAGWSRTASIVRDWRRSGSPLKLPGWPGPAYAVDAPGPGVFVAGWRRPTLFVARRVAAVCTPAELAAIVAHEAAHASARDNLKKLALLALPDFLGSLRAAAAIEEAWSVAVEEEADAVAVRSGAADGVDLASAIVKVSRLACMHPAASAMGSLLAEGPIEQRVKRLALCGAPAARPSRSWVPWLVALLLPLAVPLHPALSGRLHAVTEAVVKLVGSL